MSDNLMFINDKITDNEEIPAWKLLDEACRKWAVLSQHEKTLSDYQKIKESYE